MSVLAFGFRTPKQRDGLYDKMVGAEDQTLSPGLDFGLERVEVLCR
jgi:hypothetical protein